jgi:hypothetical protein
LSNDILYFFWYFDDSLLNTVEYTDTYLPMSFTIRRRLMMLRIDELHIIPELVNNTISSTRHASFTLVTDVTAKCSHQWRISPPATLKNGSIPPTPLVIVQRKCRRLPGFNYSWYFSAWDELLISFLRSLAYIFFFFHTIFRFIAFMAAMPSPRLTRASPPATAAQCLLPKSPHAAPLLSPRCDFTALFTARLRMPASRDGRPRVSWRFGGF